MDTVRLLPRRLWMQCIVSDELLKKRGHGLNMSD